MPPVLTVNTAHLQFAEFILDTCWFCMQVEAIKSGVQPGLTMVVGPPGTGKTDTAVQIMHVLYHNCPGQRTLLITHSNQALNDLFEKILERDVPARSVEACLDCWFPFFVCFVGLDLCIFYVLFKVSYKQGFRITIHVLPWFLSACPLCGLL
jgi:hypothetical protein